MSLPEDCTKLLHDVVWQQGTHHPSHHASPI